MVTSAPDSLSTPIRFLTRKSPRPNVARCSSTAMPRCRPSASRVRSSGSAARASASIRSSAGRPARPSRRLRSAAVTIMGSPIGRQPWDTTSAVATAAGRTTPTAPSLATSPSSTSRLPPGPWAAEAAPPTTRTGGSSWPSMATTSSIGSENGSASSTRTSPGPHVSADSPPRATPDGVRAAVTRTGRGARRAARPTGRRRGRPRPRAPRPPRRRRWRRPGRSGTAGPAPPTRSRRPPRGGAASRTGPPGRRPSRSARARRPATSPVASTGSGWTDSALANGTTSPVLSRRPGRGRACRARRSCGPGPTRQWASTVP